MRIETLEISGWAAVLKALRLPYNKDTKSTVNARCDAYRDLNHVQYGVMADIDEADIKLMQTLIQRGDEHAKPLRGLMVYADITAPIDFWVELETYRVGHERLFSASTMHTEGRALHGKALRRVLDGISFGREIRKADMFSYQTLRRIAYQRYDHRKLEWHEFIEWMKTCPYADELIFAGLEDRIAEHDRLYRLYLEEE